MATVLTIMAVLAGGATAQPVLSGTEVALSSDDSMDDIVHKAAHVTPSERQLEWQRLEFTCFIHFGMNTFTGQEWGDGTEDPAWFDPSELDADQWARACVDAGMREIILTAKHHDGFCLWPSEYTEHSVKNSPWRDGQGDLVREVAEACRRHGLELGIYLSPWDRHEPSYGDSPRYNEYFRNQLTELLSNYGEISEVWFDGACGEGPNGKRQEYDWESYYAVVRELQPGAVISVVGPDVRWCGNEAGRTRESEWSVIPSGVDGQAEDLGSRAVLAEAAQRGATLKWHPAQVNTSIRPGWFYHSEEDGRVKPLDHLLDIYYGSVGGNAQFLLNLPPDRRGLIHENDVARLRELGDVLRATFDEDLAAGASCTASSERPDTPAAGAVDGDDATFWMPREDDEAPALVLELPDQRTFDTVLLQEHIQVGQRIEELALDAWTDGQWQEVASATTVGYKRLLRIPAVTTDRVRVRITSSRLEPSLEAVGLFKAPVLMRAPVVERDASGMVTVSAPEGCSVDVRINGGPAEPYAGPFDLARGGLVEAEVVPDPGDLDAVQVDTSLRTRAEFGLAKAGWRIASVSSEEPPEEAAIHAIDSDPATIWHTQWREEDPAHPHQITIDLGHKASIGGFTYLPRQNGTDGGILTRCEWYVSADGETWGDAVAVSEFDNILNSPTVRRVELAEPVEGRFVRLVSLAAVNDQPWASAAEIGVLPALP